MILYALKSDTGYLKLIGAEGAECTPLAKASVFDSLDPERLASLVAKAASIGMLELRISELTITEREKGLPISVIHATCASECHNCITNPGSE